MHAASAVLPAVLASHNSVPVLPNLTQRASIASSADAHTGDIAALIDNHAQICLHCPDEQLTPSCPGCSGLALKQPEISRSGWLCSCFTFPAPCSNRPTQSQTTVIALCCLYISSKMLTVCQVTLQETPGSQLRHHPNRLCWVLPLHKCWSSGVLFLV